MKISGVKKTSRVAAVMLCGLMTIFTLDGCGLSSASEAAAAIPAVTIPLTAKVTDSDQDISWGDSDTKIVLSDNTALVSGDGASVSGSTVTISQAGTYVLSGILKNGQIAVAADSQDKVHLVLNGVSITNQTGAPIYASQCDKLIVTLEAGTQNTLTDGGSSFQYGDTANEEPNAALFSKDDLTINGTGSLAVNGSFNNGIGTKDDLLILNGAITINAANHGIRGNDSVTVLDGSISVTAGNDGIQTNNAEDADKGWILIEGGSFDIDSQHDAVQADTLLCVTGGILELTAGGGHTSTTAAAVSEDETSDSTKGLKAGGDLYITAGTVKADSYDDTVHSNGTVTITGGTLSLSTADDGVHGDADLNIYGGTITVNTSYEGLEGYNVVIMAGDIDVNSSDDGINAAGDGGEDMGHGMMNGEMPDGAGGQGMRGFPGATSGGAVMEKPVQSSTGASVIAPGTTSGGGASVTPPKTTSGSAASGRTTSGAALSGKAEAGTSSAETCYIKITGGNIKVNSADDGLDSNGTLNISGGTLVVLTSSQNRGGTGAMDSDGKLTITGGNVIYGGTSTGDNPGTDSTQSYVYAAVTVSAGTEISLKKNGKVITSFTPDTDCQAIEFSTPDITSGESYDIYSGSTLLTSAEAGTGGGSIGGGGGGRMNGTPPDGTAGTPGQPPTDGTQGERRGGTMKSTSQM